MRKISLLITSLMLLSFMPLGIVQNSEASLGQNSISVNSGSYQAISLGNIDSGNELEVEYSVDGDIDVLLLNSAQYSAWLNGGSTHIESGSDYDGDSDSYVFAIRQTDSYYMIFDNSNQAGFASATGNTVTGDSTIAVTIPNGDLIKTRAWADIDSHSEIIIPATDSGDILSINIDCDIGFTSGDDLDYFLMDSVQTNTLQTSNWNWNMHASFEDTCSHSWEYETGKDSGWSLIVDNSDQGRTDGLSNGIMVDIEIDVRNLIPLVEVADTSRMINSGDYYRIDTGYMPANGVLDIDYSFWSHGTAILTDDLDILVMESSEANEYENSNDATVLGHTTILDAGSQSWSYQFPNAGTYSIIFDNTDEPDGGASDGSNIQVEIGITSLTIPSLFGNIWTGWHQSTHYADEGDHMALDFGNLSTGDDIYYYIDGKNEGGSIWSSKEFDILFMNKINYDLYVNGSSFSVISDGTKYKEDGLIPAIDNMSISSNDSYMLVLDAADGPNSNSADENGDWRWEFIVLSDGNSITNIHAEDNHYEDVISVGTISSPDSDGDGVRDGLDECQSTSSGVTVDSNGCDTSQLDGDGDGVTNDVDQCPNSPSGESVDMNGCAQSELDDDNDGVANDIDLCLNTPAGESVNANGCSQSQLDDDNDGVANDVDQCLNTPAGESVNANGCSQSQLDDDNDGVMNIDDLCPNSLPNEIVNSSGCSQQSDDDADGVTNSDDSCPSTPNGESVDSNGCSPSQLDSDNDGYTNNNDQCGNTPIGESVDANGCSQSQLDDDADGVANSEDSCPNSPVGESVSPDGCTDSQLDNDGDGVSDDLDQCPNTPAGESVDVVGCPETDDDNDGVNNEQDQCPNTPTGSNVDINGCIELIDDDDDGISNNADQCSDTPIGETVDSYGCSQSQLENDETSDETEPSSETDTEEDSGGLPGFGILITLASFSLAILFIGLRRNDE